MDFNLARKNMVDGQIRTSDVTNQRVLEAFLDVPREAFVPEELLELAYIDDALKVAPGRYLTTPASLAKLVQAAAVHEDDIVLVIGCATGYSTAIMSLLCSSVVALECDAQLARTASNRLAELGYGNAVVVEGDLVKGHAADGPYDLIFIDGAIGELPDALGEQLKEGGRLVAVEGSGNSAYARLWRREEGKLSSRPLFNCALPLLPGLEKAPAFEF